MTLMSALKKRGVVLTLTVRTQSDPLSADVARRTGQPLDLKEIANQRIRISVQGILCNVLLKILFVRILIMGINVFVLVS